MGMSMVNNKNVLQMAMLRANNKNESFCEVNALLSSPTFKLPKLQPSKPLHLCYKSYINVMILPQDGIFRIGSSNVQCAIVKYI